MAEELNKPNPPVDTAALIAEVEALRKSKAELLDDYKKAKEAAKAVPPNVDVDALIAFKQKKEQEELEAKGKYDEAIAKQAQQYRDAEESKNKRIQELEAKQRQLEVEAPAVTALADVVHDPRYVLSQINQDQLAREADGTVVIVDGYNRTPVKEWAMSKMPQWVQKNPRPQGGGATTTKVQADTVLAGEKNPFAPDSFNLTEQARLFRTDVNKYNMLKNQVSG
ncbi:phage minor structural protein GP20 [uncultured Mediterranean phage uvMED]|nr:phage minor structural protein GP20 [uncultured Mediterranean phage uvMED]BAR22227.1 gp8 [uncultured Mediterranean phage uvMED]BAR22262.1 gp8 [uncultured Mediterranean phage uvMED]BAR22313.1 gp8 [uncultured Mediterranean phage uvMED]BAR22363.1 gp8 [uncultured Mediterranean phage uvMED]